MLPFRRLGGPRRNLLLVVLATLLIVGVFVLVGKVAGYTKTLDSLQRASPVWLAVCLGSQIVSYGGYVAAFRAIARLDGGPALGRWLSLRIVFAALGATRLLAAGGAGGLAVLFWALGAVGLDRRESVVRVLAFNVLLFGAFGAATLVAALLLLGGVGGEAPVAMTVPWASVVAISFAAGAWVTSPSRARRLADPTAGGRLRRFLSPAIAGAATARRMAGQPRASLAALWSGPVYWLGDMVCLWAGLRAFDVHLAVPALVLAYATGYLANMLPLPTGGIGGVDAATTFALTAIGVPLAPALLGVFVYRCFSFLIPTLPAVIALPALPHIGRELARYAPHGREPAAPVR